MMGAVNAVWAQAGIEPSIEEMLADPTLGVILRHDKVSEPDLLAVIETMRARLADRSSVKEVPSRDRDEGVDG